MATNDKNCNAKEVTTDFTLLSCNKEKVADLFCLYVSTSQVEIHCYALVSMSAQFVVMSDHPPSYFSVFAFVVHTNI